VYEELINTEVAGFNKAGGDIDDQSNAAVLTV
jgi:hypothetical protein